MAEKRRKSEETGFTGKKLKMAELLANPSFQGTNTQICEMVGISQDTFYRWIKEDDVLDFIGGLVDRYTDGELAAVWKALLRQCKAGDTQAIKLYFELKGKYKQDVKVSGSGVVQIIDDIPRRNNDG